MSPSLSKTILVPLKLTLQQTFDVQTILVPQELTLQQMLPVFQTMLEPPERTLQQTLVVQTILVPLALTLLQTLLVLLGLNLQVHLKTTSQDRREQTVEKPN